MSGVSAFGGANTTEYAVTLTSALNTFYSPDGVDFSKLKGRGIRPYIEEVDSVWRKRIIRPDLIRRDK